MRMANEGPDAPFAAACSCCSGCCVGVCAAGSDALCAGAGAALAVWAPVLADAASAGIAAAVACTGRGGWAASAAGKGWACKGWLMPSSTRPHAAVRRLLERPCVCSCIAVQARAHVAGSASPTDAVRKRRRGRRREKTAGIGWNYPRRLGPERLPHVPDCCGLYPWLLLVCLLRCALVFCRPSPLFLRSRLHVRPFTT